MSLILPRRKFIAGLAALIAAPAIVRAESLMPVKAINDSAYRAGVVISYDINVVVLRDGTQDIMLTVGGSNPFEVGTIVTYTKIGAVRHSERKPFRIIESFKSVQDW